MDQRPTASPLVDAADRGRPTGLAVTPNEEPVPARLLVVANQTLGGEELTAKLHEMSAGTPCTVRLLVPVTDTEGNQWDYPAIDRFIPDRHTIARRLAEGRLEHELDRLHSFGIEAAGEVVDADPVDRVRTCQ